MEKLIKLLNEYNIELHGVDRTYKDGFDLGYEQEYMRDFRVAYLISKSFGFIKRLVDNDKIDLEKVEKKFYNEICITDYGDKDRAYGKSDLVISVLSISENPIEDLISYLK